MLDMLFSQPVKPWEVYEQLCGQPVLPMQIDRKLKYFLDIKNLNGIGSLELHGITYDLFKGNRSQRIILCP